ncbi:MAG: repeat-containing protein [Planctomycetaceae bacterium]|nr:repeat-containing protein [Planctomycetaceae bacterium]
MELDRQRAKNPGAVPADPQAQKVVLILETPHLGHIYTGGPQGSRFFAAKLLVVNLTPQPLTLKREDVKLQIDGQPHAIQEVSANLRYHGFQIGRQHVQLETVSSFKELRIPAGGTNSGWIFVPELPPGGRVPQLSLEVPFSGKAQKLDINAQQRSLLDLNVSFIGPRNCLGLFTISGELNMINLGALTDELDSLAAKKVGRVVVAWTDSASMVPDDLYKWLQQAAQTLGRGEFNNEQFPALPANIREFHLAHLPAKEPSDGGDTNWNEEGAVNRIHKAPDAAVRAALRTACDTLPREELLAAIEQGHPWARAAVLAFGAGRLPTEQLPLVLKYADDTDPSIQTAALMGLRHFGEPIAVTKLLEYVRKNVPILSPIAVASLAGSRFPNANQALLELLKTEPPESKRTIVTVLSQYPRPVWSDVLYEFAKSPNSGLNIEALRALQKVGHPQLVALLQEHLQNSDPTLRQLAFEILINRTDRESEQVAMTYTLDQIQKSTPTPLMLTLLNRVKDQRAVPLLLAQLEKVEDKDSLLDSILQIGDQTLSDKLLPLYDTLRPSSKGKILTALRKWDATKFRELAQDAVMQNDASLVNAAVQGLVDDGSLGAIKMLGDALEKNPEPQVWVYFCNALGQLGTEGARAALVKARESKDRAKQLQADQGLRQMRQRSPGIQHVYQGHQEMQAKQYKAALKHFSQAVEKDPRLPEAYVGRADCHNRLGEFEEARKDYQKALDLDPFSAQATTGVCIMRIIAGDVVPAIEQLEAHRDRFVSDPLFLYNSACAYSRALEYFEKHQELPNYDKLAAKYKASALGDLKQSVKTGFRDFNWLGEDPDLKPLHNEAEFKKILEKKDGVDVEENRPQG